MIHRQHEVFKTSNSLPDFAASYTVLALPVGAVAAAASSGTTATVDAGHGFKASDKVLIYNSSAATYVAEALSSVTGTTLVWSSATPTIAKYDLLCNLGPDSGSGATPAYTASPMYVFKDAGGGDTITNSQVTTDTYGNYEYWSRGDGRNWELILNGSTVVGVVPGWSGVGGQLNPCDFGCIADSTGDNGTNNQARLQVCIDAAANAGLTFRGPSGSFAVENRLLLPTNFRAVNDPMFKLVKRWSAAGASAQTAVLVSTVFATAAAGASTSNDNIHWEGGRLTVGAANTYVGTMFGIHSNYGVVQNIVIEEWGKNQADGGVAGHLYGNYGWIRNCQAYTSMTTASGTDGFGRAAGKGGGIVGCTVKSADDCYTFTVWAGSGIANVATTDMVLADCYGECTAGANILRLYNGDTTTNNVERITVKNLTGSSTGNLISASQHSGSSGSIKNVTIDGVTAVAASGGTSNRVVYIDGSVGTGTYQISDFHITNLHSPVSSHAAPPTGQVYFKEVNRGSFNGNRIDGSGMNAAMTAVVYAVTCKNVAFDRNTILMSQTQATTNVAAFWFGPGSTAILGLSCCDNTIIDLPSNGYGVYNEEARDYTICRNIIKIQGTGPVIGIYDLGGTVEGKGVVNDNNLSDWLALELADKNAAAPALTNNAIIQLDKGNTCYVGNIGHNLLGVETYTASLTQTQLGGTFLRAALCIVNMGSADDDTVTLPYAIPGRRITIMNTATLYDLKIYPANSDGVFGLGANTPVYLNNGASAGTVTFVARNNAAWVLESASTIADVTATP